MTRPFRAVAVLLGALAAGAVAAGARAVIAETPVDGATVMLGGQLHFQWTFEAGESATHVFISRTADAWDPASRVFVSTAMSGRDAILTFAPPTWTAGTGTFYWRF